MGNFSSNQLRNNQDLSAPLIEKQLKHEDNPQIIATMKQNKKNPQEKENSETKESTKKAKKKKLDDIILNQKDLLPEQFSSLEELQKTYLEEKENKKRSFIESSEWDLKVFEIGEITCLTVTNDNKSLISTTQTGLITVFDLETRKPVYHFVDELKRKITSIAVSGDNEYIIVGRKDEIDLLNLKTKKISNIDFDSHHSLAMLISKDNKHAVAGGYYGSFKIFDLSTQEELYCTTASVHEGPIYSMAFSNDNLYLVTGSGDGSLKIFDFNTRNEIHNFSTVHKGAISSIAISHDDKYIITGSVDHSIKVFSFKTREELYHFEEAHKDEITSVILSKDNRHIYSASKDLCIKVFDLETKQEVSRLNDIHKMQITSIVLSNNQKYLFSGSSDGSIMMFDINSQQRTYLKDDVLHQDRVDNVAISHDNTHIISSSPDGYIKVFDFHKKNEEPQSLRCGEDVLHIQIFSKNKFVMVDCENTIRFFDLESMKQTNEIKKSGTSFISPLVSSDERFLLFGTKKPAIKILNVMTFEEVREISCESNITKMDLSKDMKYLAHDGREKCEVIVFETNNKITDFSCSGVDFIKFSQDSKYLNVLFHQGRFQLYNIQAKQTVYDITSKTFTKIMDITKDNKYLINFSSSSSELEIWSSDTKQVLVSYRNVPEDQIENLVFSSDNQYMISGSTNGLIKVRRINLKNGGYEITEVSDSTSSRDYVRHISVLEDTGNLVLALDSGSVKMFDLNTKEQIDHFDLGTRIDRFDVSSNGSAIIFAVTINENYTQIKKNVVSTSQKKHVKNFVGIASIGTGIMSINLSKDGKLLSADMLESIKVFDLETKKMKWDVVGSYRSYKKRISSDNKYLISQRSRSINLYDLQTGKLCYCFKEAHNSDITGLTASTNNKYILSTSEDSYIKLFDGETKQEIDKFKNKDDVPSKPVISSDNRIFTFVAGRILKVCDVHTMKTLREFTIQDLQSCPAISKDKKSIIVDSIVFQACLDELLYVSPKISKTSVFGGYDDFITSSWPKDAEAQKELLLYSRDMYIYPHGWTLLHLLSIFKPSVISQLPEYPEYPIDFIVDSYEKTPLQYLLAQKNRDYKITNKTFKYMIDYLDDKETKVYQRQRLCSSLSQCFLVLVSQASPGLIQRYLKICYPETPLQFGQVLPSFGISEQKFVYSQAPVIDSQVLQKLYQEGDDRILFRTNLIRLDYDPRSNDMINTIHVLYENEQEIILKLPIIENLIDYLWEATKITMYITASTFSVLMITLSYYIVSGEKSIYLEISIIIFTTLFLVSETIQGIVLGMEYLRSVWNWIDVIQLILTLIVMFNKLFSHQEVIGEAWIVLIIIITGYLRWLSYLRLFTSTRILIEIILAVLFDMLGFITVIAAILIGFSLIFLEFDRYRAISQDYGIHFYNTFKLLFGNYDDTDYNLSQTILVSFLLCVLNVVLLNLLIAIIGDSYGKVQEGRDLIDAKTRLEMSQEAVILMRTIKPKMNSDKGYLIYRLPEMLEEKDLEDRQWEERVSRIENSLSGKAEIIMQTTIELKENVKEQVQKMQNEIQELKEDNKKEVKIIKENVETISKTTNELKDNISEQVGKMQIEIQGLKELVNVLLTDLNETIKTIKPKSS